MEKKIDRRIRKTQKQIQDGFIQLRKKKHIKDITVKELCESIDINRGTFYLHYKDIYDLSEQLENEMLTNFENVLNTHPVDEINSPNPLLCDLFKSIAENADFCTALLSDNGEIAFFNKLKIVIRDACFKHWLILFKPTKTDKFEYIYDFILYGCIGMVESWLHNGLKESPEEMAELVCNMIMNGINLLK